MILDSSAVVAVLRNEPDSAPYEDVMTRERSLKISAATVLECKLVLGQTRQADFDELLTSIGAAIVSFDQAQLETALAGDRRYGKRSGSKARLNFGDCFSYALAKTLDEPLLFKGDDFTHTDVRSALTEEALSDEVSGDD